MHISLRTALMCLMAIVCGGVIVTKFSAVPSAALSNVASVFFVESHPVTALRTKYAATTTTPIKKPIRILLVPGHEPQFGGAEYRNRAERDMTVELSQYLASYLHQNPRFQVLQTRDHEDWNPVLATYFISHASATAAFLADKKQLMYELIEGGMVQAASTTAHNSARPDVAGRLYAINEWANEQKIDVVINIHFNDAVRKDTTHPGTYSGFTIYVPEHQYSNSSSSKAIASAVAKRLRTTGAVSDLPTEHTGVVEDQELISTGRYNTLDAASLLVEYGYMYERQFDNAHVRSAVLKELAFETFSGLQDFFAESGAQKIPAETSYLPFTWNDVLQESKDPQVPVLALQAALHAEDYYPAATSTFHNCPLSGYFDSCTAVALIKFQSDHGIEDEVGVFGTTTEAIFNRKFGKSAL